MGAALVGAAVELAGFRTEFTRFSEAVKSSLLRVRPSHVLVDCDDPSARDEATLAAGLMTGARLFFFGRAGAASGLREIAAKYQVRVIELPKDLARLDEILARRPSPIPEQVPTH